MSSLHTLQAATQHHQAGRMDEAERLYRQVLAAEPGNADALHLLGLLQHQKGMTEDAVGLIEKAHRVGRPHAFSLNSLGAAYMGLARFREARRCFEKALALSPDYPEAHSNLGVVFQELGRPRDAEQSYRRSLKFRPDYADAHNNLADLLGELGRFEEAAQSYRQALALQPDMIEALAGLGDVLQDLGHLPEAEQCYRRILDLNPDLAEAHNNLGLVLKEFRRLAEAEQSLRHAIALNPNMRNAHHTLGSVLYELGRLPEAERSYRQALELDPEYVEARWAVSLVRLPSLCDEGNHQAAIEEIRALNDWFDSTRIDQGMKAVGIQQPFFLAYRENSNRDLLREYGALCAKLMQHWQSRQSFKPAARNERGSIRVGIVSAHIHDHSVWNAIIKGWVRHLDRDQLDLRVFYLGTRQDDETSFAHSRVSRLEQGKRSLPQWAETIAGQQLDVLIFPEIGMDPMTLQLASLRLAPVQAAAWGHPETTGLPTIDYYLSAELLEPSGAQENYTEQLVQFPGLGCCYEPLPVTSVEPDLAALGIDEDIPILICPGTPFKYAAGHDQEFVEIARGLERCRFIFFTHSRPYRSEELQWRLRHVFADAGMEFDRYGVFIPWQPRAAFYGLLRRADLMLDTVGFSGFNTAMQAIECGLPIVTREGRFMRGRFASAILRRLGLAECVALRDEDYVGLVLRLACDPGYLRIMRTRIESSRNVLYGDLAPIRAMENFLVTAAHRP